MHPVHEPVDFYKDEHEEGGFLTAQPTPASHERAAKACAEIVSARSQKLDCSKCKGTGEIDTGFYIRKCMDCCDADGN